MSLLTMPFDSHRPMNNEKNSYTKNSIFEWWGSRQKLSGLQGEILAKKTRLILCSYYSINAPVFWPLEGLPILHLLWISNQSLFFHYICLWEVDTANKYFSFSITKYLAYTPHTVTKLPLIREKRKTSIFSCKKNVLTHRIRHPSATGSLVPFSPSTASFAFGRWHQQRNYFLEDSFLLSLKWLSNK